jgi:hypothetical protein
MPFVAHRTFGWEPVEINGSWGLNTIKSGHAYSICKSLFCTKCHLLFLDIRFSEAELGNLYADYRGQEYTYLREQYEPGYRMRNEGLKSGIGYIPVVESFLEPHVDHPLSILDWGGDTGKNTPFKDKNIKFDIFDISNINVVPGAKIVNKTEAQANKYKLVVCSNVLEHIPYPADLLLDIRLAMDLNSVLYIEVPQEDVVLEKKTDLHLHKKHWHEHINFFTQKSLYALMENAGLKVIDFNELEVFSDGKVAHLFQMACKLR